MKNNNAVTSKSGCGHLREVPIVGFRLGKNLVFWIGCRLWEVVVYERWSHMEVRPYKPSVVTTEDFNLYQPCRAFGRQRKLVHS